MAPAVQGSEHLWRQEAGAVLVEGVQGSALAENPAGWLPACPPQQANSCEDLGLLLLENSKKQSRRLSGRLHRKSEIKWRGERKVMLLVIKSLVQHYMKTCFL